MWSSERTSHFLRFFRRKSANTVERVDGYCSSVISREVFFVSEGHLQNLPLAASYGCLATENLRYTARIYAISIN